jgi:1-aminocyclopropane-1-carboxylate deaminase/D-cysteine desulfhydrase-like pyridoxal-dependent ACC family enzyme
VTTPPTLELHGSPRLRARFGDLELPWVPLGSFPTAVERLAGLSSELGAEVWVKRDDRSGEAYGGNKVRKLEFLLAEILHEGRRTVVTSGAYGSHHCLATTIYARQVGLETRLVLHPQPITEHVLDDLILHNHFGASQVRVAHPAWGGLVTRAHAARADGGALIAVGGSSKRGTLGFVEAGLELADQVAAGELPRPDAVFVPCGTCGTAAGLALGLDLAGLTGVEVVAVRVVPAFITNDLNMARLRRGAWSLLRKAGVAEPPPTLGSTKVAIDPHELGPGYGAVTESASAALARFADEGLELETTYTAKAAASLLRRAREDRAEGEPPVLLFWNTLSSVDMSAHLAAADPAAVPPAFHAALREGGRL